MKHHLLILLCTLMISRLAFSQETFITTWQTDKIGELGVANDISFSVEGSDLEIAWGDGEVDSGIGSQVVTHEYAQVGTYTVEIRGQLNRFIGHGGSLGSKLLTVEQWGDTKWSSMEEAFAWCGNVRINATDAPDLSNVTNMSNMFLLAKDMNDPMNHWDVRTITDMSRLFGGAESFNQPLSNWDVSNVSNMHRMFWKARSFNQSINNWDISNVTKMDGMFHNAEAFDQDISAWDVSNVTDMSDLFLFAKAFNQDISSWDVSNVTNMSATFWNAASFNQDISAWNVSKVTDMSIMFLQAESFNQDISNWDVGNVTDMRSMFQLTFSFNQDIGNWDMKNVKRIDGMFSSSKAFNQSLANWDVSNVESMVGVFASSEVFNQDLSAWNVSNAQDMRGMFQQAVAFNQDLGAWDIQNVTRMASMFDESGMDRINYDNTLFGWGSKSLRDSVELGVEGLSYCDASYRKLLIDEYGWKITGDHQFDEIMIERVVADTVALCQIPILHPPLGSVCNSDSILVGIPNSLFPIERTTTVIWTLKYGNLTEKISQEVVIQGGRSECNPLSLQDEGLTRVYPNPFDDILRIEGDVVNVVILDLLGRKIETVKSFENTINLSHLVPGSYLVYLVTKDGTEHHRIIKN